MFDKADSFANEPNNEERAKQHNALGTEYLQTNFLDKAEVEYKKAIELNPAYEAAYSNLVSVLERRNKISEARQYIDISKQLFPEGQFITLNEGIVLKREGRLEEAAHVLETKAYPPDSITEIKVRHELGLIYDRMNDPQTAFDKFKSFNTYATQAFGITDQAKQSYRNKLERCKQAFVPEFLKSWQEVSPTLPAPVCLMGFMCKSHNLI